MRNFIDERCAQLAKEMVPDTDAIIDEIRPLLADRSPMTQGAVIAELAAMWLGGHPPDQRDELLKVLVTTAIAMIALHDPWKRKND